MARRLLLALALAAVAALSAASAQETCSGAVPAPPRRGARVSVASFGGAGDGRTLNTVAFARAVASIDRLRAPGGAELYVPPGVWLTGPFNLTSCMTLFLARGAVIRATQVSGTRSLLLLSSQPLARPPLLQPALSAQARVRVDRSSYKRYHFVGVDIRVDPVFDVSSFRDLEMRSN
jgi:hypothetical protein